MSLESLNLEWLLFMTGFFSSIMTEHMIFVLDLPPPPPIPSSVLELSECIFVVRFCCYCFWDISLCRPRWPSIYDPPASAFLAGITGVCCHKWSLVFLIEHSFGQDCSAGKDCLAGKPLPSCPLTSPCSSSLWNVHHPSTSCLDAHKQQQPKEHSFVPCDFYNERQHTSNLNSLELEFIIQFPLSAYCLSTYC